MKNKQKISVPFRSVPFRSVPFRSVPFRSVLLFFFLVNNLTLFGQYHEIPVGNDYPESVLYSELYETGNGCGFPPTIYGYSASINMLTIDYTIKSRGDGNGPFRVLKYEYWLTDPNSGSESKEAETFESDVSGGQVTNSILTPQYGGSRDIPRTLRSGQYRVKLVVSYNFSSPPSSLDTRLLSQLKKNGGAASTVFDATPPPQFSQDITVDPNFACFNFIACQKIDDFRVEFTPNGDFIFANVSPAANYQFAWDESPNLQNYQRIGVNTDNVRVFKKYFIMMALLILMSI
jgi:hypothetical protein